MILAGTFEFIGVMLLGRYVSGNFYFYFYFIFIFIFIFLKDTLKNGIINSSNFSSDPQVFALGMFCASIAASSWLLVATLIALPVSTTHSIVGGIIFKLIFLF